MALSGYSVGLRFPRQVWLSPIASPGAGPCTWSLEPHEVPTDPLLSLSIFQHLSFPICLQFPWELPKDRHLQQQGLGCWGACGRLQCIPWDREAVLKGNRISLGLYPLPPAPLGAWESCPRVDFCFPAHSMAGFGLHSLCSLCGGRVFPWGWGPEGSEPFFGRF